MSADLISLDLDFCHQIRSESSREPFSKPHSEEIQLAPEHEVFHSAANAIAVFVFHVIFFPSKYCSMTFQLEHFKHSFHNFITNVWILMQLPT